MGVKALYGVTLGVRQCQRFFHKIGYTLQRPQTKPSGSTVEAREAFKKLLMVVTDPNVELWFEDEAHIGRNTTVTRMWAPRDEQPKLLSAATRQKVGMLGVVNPALGELF